MMSEHKTHNSNWTEEQKTLYQKRREHGVRGEPGYVNAHLPIKDEQGQEQQVPLGHVRLPKSRASRYRQSRKRSR